jgi:glutamine amidotransferase
VCGSPDCSSASRRRTHHFPPSFHPNSTVLTIIDYGMGNLRSVQKAFERMAVPARVTSDPHIVATSDRLVLPGVGAFRDAIAELRQQQLVEPILNHIAAEKPFLGICLGLQLLFDVSYEDGEWPGLGVLSGTVERFPDFPPDATGQALKVPHMGWNTLETVHPSPLLDRLPPDPHMYFVHSYFVVPKDEAVVATRTRHGVSFVSSIRRGRLFATQFHPEKSQRLGLQLLENFAHA